MANGIHALTAPDNSKESWILSKLIELKEIPEKDSIVEETDLFQIYTGTLLAKNYKMVGVRGFLS